MFSGKQNWIISRSFVFAR